MSTVRGCYWLGKKKTSEGGRVRGWQETVARLCLHTPLYCLVMVEERAAKKKRKERKKEKLIIDPSWLGEIFMGGVQCWPVMYSSSLNPVYELELNVKAIFNCQFTLVLHILNQRLLHEDDKLCNI